MTTWPTFTVAVLNHRRPHLLRRVLGAVAQLDYPAFEVVVVGDQPDLAGYDLPPGFDHQIRYTQVEQANISHSRNAALRLAAGEIVAFCDDDAVPEPDWLRALAEAFRRPDVAAASGLVLASDGLTVEWQGRFFLPSGRELRDPLAGSTKMRVADAWSQTTDGRFMGLIGVNSAFRRTAILEAGGFDEAYRYFLEETDIAIRLARKGWSAAMVPRAVVHHLREQNAVRSALSVPRNLHQIAASKAYFCDRHMPASAVERELERYRAARLAELDPYLRLGTLRSAGLKKLESQLDSGLEEGSARMPVLPLDATHAPPEFHKFHAPGAHPQLRLALVSGWGIGPITKIRRLARRLAGAGHMVSCFTYMSGPRPARVMFSNGVWTHSGGTWRFNQRDASGRFLIRRNSRAKAEIERVAEHRVFDAVLRLGRTTTSEGSRLLIDSNRNAFLVSPVPGGKDVTPDVIAALQVALGTGCATTAPDQTDTAKIRRNGGINPSVEYS